MRSRARDGNHMHEAEQILVGVAKPHPPADARLEVRRRPGEVERDHALVGVPGVDHAVDVLVRRRHLQTRRAARTTASAQIAEGGLDDIRLEVPPDHRADERLVQPPSWNFSRLGFSK